MAQHSDFLNRAETPINWNGSTSSNSTNYVQMMPLPSTSRASVAGEAAYRVDEKNDEKTAPHDDKNRFNFFGKSVMEKTYCFTGTVERVITWHRMFKGRCYYEVIASVVSIQDGSHNLQKIVLLKDKKGPILQVVHYTNHMVLLKDFSIGQILRCFGYMTAPNALTAVSIRLANPEEVATLMRFCHIGNIAVSNLIKSEEGINETIRFQ